MVEHSDAREARRLAVLDRYEILDTGPERAFDDLTALAAFLCGTPIALMSLVASDRQWFKARVGLDATETSRDLSFCAHAIRQDGLFVVPDALKDERFASNALVTSEPNIRFYAGSPLIAPGGEALGTLCVIDRVPRDLTAEQAEALEALGRQVVGQIELRQKVAELSRTLDDRDRAESHLRASQARKSAILEAALDCIIAIDHEGKIREFNAAAEQTFGYDRAEAIGQPMSELIVPREFRRGHLEGMARFLASGSGRLIGKRVEVPATRRDGSTFPAELTIAVIRQDGPPAFVAHLRDITERRRAEDELRRAHDELEARVAERTAEIRELNARLEQRLRRLDSLRQIDVAISGSFDIRLTLGVILDQVLAQLGVDAASVLLHDPHTGTLGHAAGKGFRSAAIAESSPRLGEGDAGRAALEQQSLFVADLAAPPGPSVGDRAIRGEDFVSYFVVPLVVKGQVKGVLECYHRSPLAPDREWTDFLESLAGQAAIAVDNATLFRDLQRSNAGLVAAYDATIEGWARAMDLRDKETEGHSRRVTEMTVMLARAMGVEGADLQSIRRGALLHDIGKLGIPDDILLKPGKLTEDEWAVMRRHPEYAHEWLSPIAFLRPALDIPRCHHEKWDGSGYPRGLVGEQIPLPARIFAAVDIWDALRSDRPYRAGWTDERVVEHLRSLSGTHLDPRVVEAFLAILAGDKHSITARGEGQDQARAVMLEYQLQQAMESIQRLEARYGEQADEISRLAQLSLTDDLTGLRNRRHFREALESAFSFACRHQQPLSVVLLEVDAFKAYRDEHGQQAGDDVLRLVASILGAEVRPHDVIARLGGEEFAVLLPAADAAASRAVADRLRGAVADRDWPHRRITASLGVTTILLEALAAADLIESAETALRHSRRLGHDRITHSEDIQEAMPVVRNRWDAGRRQGALEARR